MVTCRWRRSRLAQSIKSTKSCNGGLAENVCAKPNISIAVARRAWDVVHRLHSTTVPVENPWRGVLKVTTKSTKPAATRAEAYALAAKLGELGEPHLGVAALICFEWLQRPENVLTGKITWADYHSSEQSGHVRVLHHKTGEVVWMPLEDGDGQLYPELEAYLADLPRLGLPIVLTAGVRGPARPYSMAYAQRRVRRRARPPSEANTSLWMLADMEA